MTPKTRAKWWIFWSSALLLGLSFIVATADADDTGAKGLAIVVAAILVFPSLLLSLLDLGRALRSENGGDHRATWPIWLLSQLQAAFGATCMAVGAFVIYHHISEWVDTPTISARSILAIYIVTAFFFVIIGFNYLHAAFARGRDPGSGKDDV